MVHFDPPRRRWSLPVLCLLTFSLLFLLACLLFPETSHRSGVVLSKEAKIALAARESISPLVFPDTASVARVNEEDDFKETKSSDPESVEPEGRALPPYGAEAIGEAGAWDGRDDGVISQSQSQPQGEREVTKDHLGVPCEDVKDIPTSRLRHMLPPVHIIDYCDYARRFNDRDDRLPSEILASDRYVGPESIARFVHSGLWSISDFERINFKMVSPTALLNLYLILRDGNSPRAVVLLQSLNEYNREPIDIFLRTGTCPTDRLTDLSGPHCLTASFTSREIY